MEQVLAWMEAHDKLAGWAQAVGAVAAIVVAFVVAALQARYALRHEERRSAERLRSLARTLLY